MMMRSRLCVLAIALAVFGRISSASAAPAVAAGSQHAVVLTDAGVIWAWGGNAYGQLGDGTYTARLTPTEITSINGVMAIAAGNTSTYALKTDGTVRAWGDNTYGQLGDGTTTSRPSPVAVSGLSNVMAIAAGLTHAVALKSDGTVWAWGRNNYGQIGDGTTTTRTTPVQVASLGTNVIAIAAHGDNSHAVKADTTLWSWGTNSNGEVGDGTTTSPRATPVQTSGLAGIASASGGAGFSYAIDATGALKSWGYGYDGELGNGTWTQKQSTPVSVTGMATATTVRGGSAHAVAAKADGTVWAWGYNAQGQLGDGTWTTRYTPVQAVGVSSAAAVTAGQVFSIAIASDGRVWTWGSNYFGQLGDGTYNYSSLPIQISDASFNWRVATPTLSPYGGSFSANVTVTIADATAGTTMHYTTNGVDPTESDPTIASGGTVSLTQTTTLKARAWTAGRPASNIATATYTLTVATPAFSPGGWTYTSAQNVTISTSTSGATIRYTTDGTTPTAISTLYSGPIAISTGTTLKAMALKSGWTTSSVTSATYTFNYGTLAAPVLTPAPGQFDASQQVTLTAASFATIRYTTNGSTPTASSPIYTTPVTVNGTVTIYAKAFHPDWTTSPTSGGVYTVKVSTPVFSPDAGSYVPGQAVTITDETPNAVIRYTTNGLDPTGTDAIIASGSTVIAGNYTLKARAFITGWTSSDIKSAGYALTGPLTSYAVAAGNNHTVGLKSDGTVWTWGSNSSGELGDSSLGRSMAAVVNGLTGITGIGAGINHNVALQSGGTVWAWGSNAYGQLGDNTTTSRSAFAQVSGLASVVAVAAGSSHSVALKSDGTVWTWGRNTNGQLGDGTQTQRNTPVQVAGLSNVVAIAAGDTHTIARKSDGSVWTWGSNGSGELGDNTTTGRLSPVQVTGITASAGPWAGNAISSAATSDGGVRTWGWNDFGQLGLGSTSPGYAAAPTVVPTLANVTLADGSTSFIAIAADTTVWTWGKNGSGQIGNGATANSVASPYHVPNLTGVGGVAAGLNHSAIVTTDGAVWAWGYNGSGQFGDGTISDKLTPIQISEPGFAWKTSTPRLSPGTGTYSANTNVTITAVTPGAEMHYTTNGADPTQADATMASGSVLAVTQTLTLSVRAWAAGLPPSNVARATYTLKPATPAFSPGGGTYISARSVTIATSTTGATIFYTLDGSTPTESSTMYTGPLTIATGTTLEAIAWKSGWTPSTVTTATYTFNYGALAAPVFTPPPGEVTYGQTVAISAAPVATIRYTTDGSTPTSSSPIYVSPLPPITATTTISAKAFHPDYTTSAQAGGVYTARVAAPVFSPEAGAYPYSQLITITDGTPGAVIHYTTNGLDPTATDLVIATGGTLRAGHFTLKARGFLTGATASPITSAAYTWTAPPTWSVAAGFNHSVVLDADGTVWTWGANTDGVLGDDGPGRSTPGMVAGLSDVTAVSSGAFHVLALKADGAIWAWGASGSGQLAVEGLSSRSTPAPIDGLSSITAIAAGSFFSVALKSDGTVWTWGENETGQLGDGTRDSRTTPTAVAGLGDVVAIAAGDGHVVVRKSDGTVWAWGNNENGQVGDNTTEMCLTPTLVPGITGTAGPWTGYAHTFVADSDGTLWAWGANGAGQLGLGEAGTPKTAPTLVPSLANVAVVAAAGHSIAVRTDGTVWTWGNNALGSVGDQSRVNRAAPSQVMGLANISSVAAGLNHSLAVTTDGTVWTWGANGDGQLGDGTIDAQLAGERVSEPGLLWKTSTPLLWPPTGTYNAATSVTLSAATPGATIHYTTNGATPTDADQAVASGGTVTIDRSLTLNAAAWAPGYAGSTVATATYALALPTPTLWPAGGTFEGRVTVSLASTVAGTTIRYTTDGSSPTAASPIYSRPLAIAATTTIQARAFRVGWTDSPVAMATYVIEGTAGPCRYTITPTSIVASASGQTGYVAVTATGPTCMTWTPASSADWVTLDPPIFDQWDGFVQRVLADQPIAYWGFHETIGATTALDYTGHGLTATLARGAAVKTLGLVDLDGISGKVVVGSSPLLNFTHGLTVELDLQTTRANARLIGATNDPWELYVGDGAVLELRLIGFVLRGNRMVADDQVHLIDATWDGAKATLYVDGVLDAQLNVSGTLPPSTAGLMIGAHPTRGDYFAGQLQVVTVFDHALTAAQVADRFVWENGLQSETSGVFGYTIAANALSSRDAVISVTGQSLPVFQAGAPPVISSVSPASGPTGTPVTIAGSRFGAAQGSGSIWLGTKAGTVVSWSDTQIVAAVATGSVSGTVEVRQAGTSSNAVAFTVLTPSITSVTIGGDGTQVTITGSNFGSQDTGQLWLGTAEGIVTSWSNTQIVATIAAGSSNGRVQVLQGGVWGTAVPLTVANPPQIFFTTPRSGGAGTVVTIQGTNFGASQGSSVVSIGGASASINAWSNTQISMTVPATATTGVLKIQKDGVWSNAVIFIVSSGTSAPLTVSPNVVSLLVGDTRAMQSLDVHGAAVTGLTWSSSDPTIVSVSTDEPPLLTALAPGTVTITAGGASADVTVYAGSALPTGTALWSVPGSGSGNVGMAIAVPNYDAVADVFAIRGNTVQAVTSDGEVAWTAETTSPPGWGLNYFLPDFQGGMVVLRSDQQSIYRLDGLTGQAQPAYTTTTDAGRSIGLGDPAIHPDGTIVTIDYACHDFCPKYEESTDGAWVVGIDPASGTAKFRVPLVNDVYTGEVRDAAFCQNTVNGPYRFAYHAWPSPITIAGDGYAYLSYRTLKVDGKQERSAEQPFEDGVYDLWEQVVRDVVGTNFVADFPAAQQHLDAMLQLIGPTWQTRLPTLLVQNLGSALSLHNRTQAIDYINLLNGLGAPGGFGGYFRRLCDSTSTTVTQFHLLRVGADGSSSDVVVHESSESSTTIALLAPEAPGYHITETEEGPSRVEFSYPNIITQADQGAVYSWKRLTYCDQDNDHGVRSYRHVGPCEAAHEHHLTTMAGGAVAADVVWTPTSSMYDPPVRPVLQLEDGSFAGVADSSTAGRALLVFDAAGQVKWRLPRYYPVITTPGGLITGTDGGYQAFDASGTAIGQIATIPRYSWSKDSYAATLGGIGQVVLPNTRLGTSFAAVQEGNLSANGTSLLTVDLPVGGNSVPVHLLKSWGGECKPSTSPARLEVTAATNLIAWNKYEALRKRLWDPEHPTEPTLLQSNQCSDFFLNSLGPLDRGHEWRVAAYGGLDGGGRPIIDRLAMLRPYDGRRATLTLAQAGLMTAAQQQLVANAPNIYVRRTFDGMVCKMFMSTGKNNRTYAAAQTSPMASESVPRDIYINTHAKVLPGLTEGTILHETLHSITGLNDFWDKDQRAKISFPQGSPGDLKTFIGIETTEGVDPACPTSNPQCGTSLTIDITRQLAAKMCVVQ